MSKALNLTGQIFGRWTVLEPSAKTNRGSTWLCECSCGTRKVVPTEDLTAKHSTSCGCYRREFGSTIGSSNLKHGQIQTPTYDSWRAMKYRCLSPTSKDYPRYGGRGITIYPDWLEFEAFLRDNGERPPGTSLDRIDNMGNYEPGNTRWASPKEQSNNRRQRRTTARAASA